MHPAPTRLQFLGFFVSPPLYIMLTLMVIEALLAACTTWLVIRAGRDVAENEFLTADLIWIVVAQSLSYIAGAISWMYAERAGFRAFGRYMMMFVRDNRQNTTLLQDKTAREQVEPFLTGTTFVNIFNLMYELESQLKLALGLVFNSIVLGLEIDSSLSLAYGAVFALLLSFQWLLRGRVAKLYLENQRQNNRVIAHGYTAWDNIYSGNRYNLRLWLGGFKAKLRDCLTAQIKAIMAREGLSAAGAIIGLTIVFAVISTVSFRAGTDTTLLIALAATLPRQIEMTNNVHELASGWNDVVALWTRFGDVVRNMRPSPDPFFNERIKFDRLMLLEHDVEQTAGSIGEAVALINAKATGRINVRGGNGAGKSTLLAALKADLKNRAYYWPTSDRLAFDFARAVPEEEDNDDDEPKAPVLIGFSSGERQLRSLQEIVSYTDARIYLLDEWDANLDLANRADADALVEELAKRARVVEISHRDRA